MLGSSARGASGGSGDGYRPCAFFVSAPPRWAPATIVGLFKGYTSRKLRERFPKLKRLCGREQLWTQAYYVGTAGAVSAEVIRRYIQECQEK